ncbi:hypothetical protein H633G_06994 [Metarhizium anisopliae BRIP 53284]|nr:hypothetical protein H633G_06994 [Metarhizium anisopliae BRIP 53284]
MAAFNDPQKLADAIALAQSFKSGQFSEKRDRKSKARVEAIDIADSSEIHRDRTWHTRQQLVADKGWQIGQLRAEDAVIGKAVFDFLNRNDLAPTPAATPEPINRLPPTPETTADLTSPRSSTATPKPTVKLLPASETTADLTSPRSSAATPKPTVKLPPTPETTVNFTGPRSPTSASASTPLTPESLIQGPGDNHTSPADSPQNPADEQEADQLAELLSSFSFKEKSSTGDDPGNIMDRFLELLAKKEMSEHLSQDKQSCVKISHTVTHNDAKQEEKDGFEETIATSQHHQPMKADQPVSINANADLLTTNSKQLCPKAPAFAPSKAESANGGIGSLSPKEIEVIDNDQHQGEKLPFTGQFSSSSDGTPYGHWPATEKVTPALPVTYTVWVPVHYPMPNAFSDSTMAMNGTQAGAPNLGSRQPQPMQGLSASKWAHQPPKSG